LEKLKNTSPTGNQIILEFENVAFLTYADSFLFADLNNVVHKLTGLENKNECTYRVVGTQQT